MQTKRKSVSRSVSVPNLQNSKHQTLSLQFTASLDPYRLGNVWSAQAGDLSNLIHPGKPNQILAGKVSLKIPLIQHISSYTRYIASSDIFTSLKFKTCLQSYHWIGSRDFFRTWFWDSILVCWSLANGFPKHLKKKLGTNRLNRRSKLVEFSEIHPAGLQNLPAAHVQGDRLAPLGPRDQVIEPLASLKHDETLHRLTNFTGKPYNLEITKQLKLTRWFSDVCHLIFWLKALPGVIARRPSRNAALQSKMPKETLAHCANQSASQKDIEVS